MKSKSVKILLTGLPGCGKTTAVMKITANLDPQKIAGFYTQEIRQDNIRKGFSWARFDGDNTAVVKAPQLDILQVRCLVIGDIAIDFADGG